MSDRSTIRYLVYLCFALTLVLSISTPLYAQSDPRFQIWTDFNPRAKINEQLTFVSDLGYRVETGTNAQTFLVRASLRYSPNKTVSFDAGVANFNVWDTDIVNSIEFRTFEYVLLNWPLWKFKFRVRLGLDQRWLYFKDLASDKFIHRSRLRIGLRSPEFKIMEGESKFYITTNIELLRDINNDALQSLIDHNRFMIGLGSLVNEKLRAELQYQLIGLNDQNLGEFIRDVNMIRIRVFYAF